jgi:hypothetical protein
MLGRLLAHTDTGNGQCQFLAKKEEVKVLLSLIYLKTLTDLQCEHFTDIMTPLTLALSLKHQETDRALVRTFHQL